MRFLSIYKTAERNTPPPPEHFEQMGQLIEEMMKSGKLLATEGCLPSRLGVRVRLAGGDISVTDGPFTDPKSWLAALRSSRPIQRNTQSSW